MIFWILNSMLTQKWLSNVEAQCGLGSWMMYKGELSFHRTWFDYDLELVWIFSCTFDVQLITKLAEIKNSPRLKILPVLQLLSLT